MFRKALLAVTLVAVSGSLAVAQDHRVELSGTAGWTFSDGVSGGPVVVPDAGSYNRVDPKDAFSWGLRLGFLVSENVEVGRPLQPAVDEPRGLGDEFGDSGRSEGLQLPRLPRVQLRRRPLARFVPTSSAGWERRSTAASRAPRDPAEGHRRQHPVLDHLGARREDVPWQERRHPPRRALDSHLHQVGRDRLVVRPVLGLLRHRRRAVLEPVRARGRDHAAVLGPNSLSGVSRAALASTGAARLPQGAGVPGPQQGVACSSRPDQLGGMYRPVGRHVGSELLRQLQASVSSAPFIYRGVPGRATLARRTTLAAAMGGIGLRSIGPPPAPT